MNDTTSNHDPGREQLSAFLDDELAPDEARFLLRRLEADPALARHLHQYAAVGEVLRGNPSPMQVDLAARVQRAVRGEPVPESTPAAVDEDSATHWSAGLMPFARVAAAAVVAAVVVFTVLPQAPGTGPTLADSQEGAALEEALFPTVPPVSVTPRDSTLVGVPGNAAFASYLLKHTSAVGPTVRPDFVASQRAYDHLHPAAPSPSPVVGAEEEAAAQDEVQ